MIDTPRGKVSNRRKKQAPGTAAPKYKLLAHNVYADDSSRTNASPAVSDDQILLRSDQYLYCIGKR